MAENKTDPNTYTVEDENGDDLLAGDSARSDQISQHNEEVDAIKQDNSGQNDNDGEKTSK